MLRGPWAALRLRRELAGTSGGSIARNLKVRHAYAVMIEELVQLELNRMQKIDHGRPGDRDVSRCQILANVAPTSAAAKAIPIIVRVRMVVSSRLKEGIAVARN